MAQPPHRHKLTAPDKGSFPLDHFGECTQLMTAYMECMKRNRSQSTKCRIESRDYLQCRMDHNLMADEDLKKLGFKDLS